MPQCFDGDGKFIDCSQAQLDSQCFDDNAQEVDCSAYAASPAAAVAAGAFNLGPSVGLASAGGGSGSLSLTAPSAGSGNVAGIATGVASFFSGIVSAVSPKPTSTLRPGNSGLVSGNSVFGNPIMLIALGLLAFLAFKSK